MSGRKLRILFVVRPGALLRFPSVVVELLERGHELHLGFVREPDARVTGFLEPLAERYGGLTWDIVTRNAPTDGWRNVAFLVRGLGDVARYTHPRYRGAPVLRERMTAGFLRLVEEGDVEPLARRYAERQARRLAAITDEGLAQRSLRREARYERAIPPSRSITEYVRGHRPDVVLATPLVRPAADQVEFLKSARSLGLPTGAGIASWDNLTNKGLLKFVPDRVLLWNQIQADEAVELHGVPAGRIRATGAHVFDEWFARKPALAADEFQRGIGLDPERPYVLYLCSSPAVARDGEVAFVTEWIEAIRAAGGDVGIAIRPHPNAAKQWRGVDLSRLGNVALCGTSRPVGDKAHADFFEILVHSAAVVGINTTAMIEAAILEKSVLTILNPAFAQETTLHFHYLLEENGGFLHVAPSLTDHVAQLAGVLEEDEAGAERRRRFVERFIRPHGLDRPATPIFADAVEELATVQPAREPSAGLLIRAGLAVEAALCSAYSRRHARDEKQPVPKATAVDGMSSGVLVHIGYHKTGTTWLQKRVFSDPRTGMRWLGKFDAREAVRGLVSAQPLEFDPADARRVFEPLLEGIRAEGLVPVLSFERLSGHPFSGGHDSKEIAERLAAVFDDASILVVIREQRAIIRSAYKQYVQNGGPCRIEDFLEPPAIATRRIPLFDYRYYEYHHLLGFYRSLFGAERVLALPFEWLTRDAPRFVRAIGDLVGVPLDDELLADLPFERPKNAAPGAAEIELHRRLNRLGGRADVNISPALTSGAAARLVRSISRSSALSSLARRLPDDRAEARLKKQVAELVGSRYGESNRITAELTGIDLEALGWDVR